MADLFEKTPCNGLEPLTIGTVTLSETSHRAITSLAPFKGREGAVSKALEAQIGAGFPKPGRSTGKEGARAIWSGVGQALVLGPALDPIEGAAISDQSDAWTCVALEGQGARDVLARLCPLDLRPEAFKRGHAARSLLGHMSAVILRTGENRYALMVFRSMAGTLLHELEEAMTGVAARAAL